MKLLFFCALSLFILTAAEAEENLVTGKIISPDACVQPAQLFVSQNSLLLFQIEVPVNGSFSFRLNKGSYEFLAANREGCESKKRSVVVKSGKQTLNLSLKRKKEAK